MQFLGPNLGSRSWKWEWEVLEWEAQFSQWNQSPRDCLQFPLIHGETGAYQSL